MFGWFKTAAEVQQLKASNQALRERMIASEKKADTLEMILRRISSLSGETIREIDSRKTATMTVTKHD
jgi:hypothetical protein